MDVAVYAGAVDASVPAALPPPLWQRQQWEAVLGDAELPPRLEECLHSMRNKESAAFRVRGDLLPDAAPAFGIPAAADRGGADVTYLVELHAMHSVKSWEFEGEAKIAEGLARKDRGNAALREGRLELAERYYRRALEFVGEDFGLKDELKAACHAARIAVCGNLSQVLLQQRQHHEAITFCDKVLALEPTNAKALFRLAKAHDGLQDWEAAMKAVDRILVSDANNADASALKQHIASEKKAFDQKQKSLFKKMFA
ncbi:FK506-binding protein 4/5 [Strigomonas culicis]|nr:FK506-binding protein 4/5 [Strigomonas culicis]|eukprot:EPY36731.1 FK506-binding protein 4/5 [Strigomonas culicis]